MQAKNNNLIFTKHLISMKPIFSFVITVFSVLPFCINAQTNNSGPQSTGEPTVYKGVIDNSCAVEVNFASPGSGIDISAYEKVIAEIDKNKLAYTAKNVGREGETRICLPLTELKRRKKKQFINKLKKIVKEGQYTSVSIR